MKLPKRPFLKAATKLDAASSDRGTFMSVLPEKIIDKKILHIILHTYLDMYITI